MNFFQWRSLKTRVTLFTLAVFLIGIWSLAFYASRMLHEDMERVLGEQQFSTVSILAAQINEEVDMRLKALKKIAGEIPPAMLGNPAALQHHLELRPIFQFLFNGGTFATGIDGTALASVPLSIGRTGVNYLDRDFIAAALNEGKAMIGQPVIGKRQQIPVFSIGVPIRDTQGKVIGALAGVTDLSKPNFLDKITESRYGRSGGYFVVVPRLRLPIAASDESRVMQPFPARGVIPTLDRFLDGDEGSAVYVNPLGVEVLGSAKTVPIAAWFVGAVLPTAEAFAPIHAMLERILLATIIFTLMAGGMTWWLTSWMLKRQLSPMLAAAKTLATLSDTDQPPQPLPITSQDEIGQLIGGFNRLLKTLTQREEELKRSNTELARQSLAITRAKADLQRFAEVTAHHLQEPARRIANYSERLTTQLGGRLDVADARLSLEFIDQEARRQQNLLRAVDRYLASDKPRGKVESVDAGKTVVERLARSKERISAAGAEITLGHLPAARIDLPRLSDLFEVALDNALCHGRSEHPLRIKIDGERQGSKARYRISDNGPGVEEQYRERVFRVFECLTPGGALAGTGIGLAILRRITESCDGRAWIEETPGGGCSVLFELPIGEEPL